MTQKGKERRRHEHQSQQQEQRDGDVFLMLNWILNMKFWQKRKICNDQNNGMRKKKFMVMIMRLLFV